MNWKYIIQASKAQVWQDNPNTSVWKLPKNGPFEGKNDPNGNIWKLLFFSKCLDIAIFAQKLSILTQNRRNSRKSFPSWLNLLNSVSEFWFETVCDWNI